MFDYPTLLTVVTFVSAVAGVLLLFAWVQNRSIDALGIWGIAYLAATAAMTLLIVNRSTPQFWLPAVGFPLWIAAHGLMWKAARSFEGRRTPLPWVLAGAAVWIAACLFDGFYESPAARIMLASGLMGVYLLLCAAEIWRAQDRELVSRWPAIVLLSLHGTLFIARVPFVPILPFPGGVLPPDASWLPVGLFEMMFHIFCMSVLLVNMAKERAELRQRQTSLIDPLTGVANRRAFFERAGELIGRARRDGRAAILILFDLDRFKTINDTYGHQAGDRVLNEFCAVALARLRPDELFGRFGGEEFACLMTDRALREASTVADQIRRMFGGKAIAIGPDRITVTVSAGIAMSNDCELDKLFVIADRALYRAKAKGRNCVETARAPLYVVEPASAAAG